MGNTSVVGVVGGIGGSKFIWSIQGILDEFDPSNGTNIIPIGSLVDGSASGNYSRVDLQEENPNGWRIGDKLIVPAGFGGWYLISFVCEHTAVPILGVNTQAAFGDFRVGIIINGDANNQAMTGDAAGGRSDSGSFSCPIKLQEGDEIEFEFDIDTGQINEDFIIRGSVVDLGGVTPVGTQTPTYTSVIAAITTNSTGAWVSRNLPASANKKIEVLMESAANQVAEMGVRPKGSSLNFRRAETSKDTSITMFVEVDSNGDFEIYGDRTNLTFTKIGQL